MNQGSDALSSLDGNKGDAKPTKNHIRIYTFDRTQLSVAFNWQPLKGGDALRHLLHDIGVLGRKHVLSRDIGWPLKRSMFVSILEAPGIESLPTAASISQLAGLLAWLSAPVLGLERMKAAAQSVADTWATNQVREASARSKHWARIQSHLITLGRRAREIPSWAAQSGRMYA